MTVSPALQVTFSEPFAVNNTALAWAENPCVETWSKLSAAATALHAVNGFRCFQWAKDTPHEDMQLDWYLESKAQVYASAKHDQAFKRGLEIAARAWAKDESALVEARIHIAEQERIWAENRRRPLVWHEDGSATLGELPAESG